MKPRGLVGVGLVLVLCYVSAGVEPQPPLGSEGLSFRSESFFEAADDFVAEASEPILSVRWWGSYADEVVPHDHTLGPFRISIYESSGGLPVDPPVATYEFEPAEIWTGGTCRGIEGLGGGDSCPGPEPLYRYKVCLDPPFVPVAETRYWLGILHLLDQEDRFWAWHEADVPHPTGEASATWSFFSGWASGMINACPGDFSATVGPYDLAYELLTSCSAATGDCDNDGDVDLVDFASLVDCAAGPGIPPPPQCVCVDLDGDEDVDFEDFAAFQLLFGGAL